MNKSEYLNAVNKWEIVDDRVEAISEIYIRRIPELLQRIISHSNEPYFFDDGSHVLSLGEMLSIEETLGVSFSDRHLIPVIDCCDGDYIVYDYGNGIWAVYNIVDDALFRSGNSLGDLL